MVTYLFVTEQSGELNKRGKRSDWWSCSKAVQAGDRALVFVSTQGISWLWQIESDARPNKRYKWACDVRLVRPIAPPITMAEMKQEFSKPEWPRLFNNFWGASTLRLSDAIVNRIWYVWPKTGIAQIPRLAEEHLQSYQEGATTKIVVNRYERNTKARAYCIEEHGAKCSVCGMAFAARYGANAGGFIHVHHLTPFARRHNGSVTDAAKDLVPVCPNCHAVIHMRTPPYTPKETRRMLRPKRTIN